MSDERILKLFEERQTLLEEEWKKVNKTNKEEGKVDEQNNGNSTKQNLNRFIESDSFVGFVERKDKRFTERENERKKQMENKQLRDCIH